MELSALESAKLWAEIVTASVTALVVSVAALAAIWRFLLQPIGHNWNVSAGPCKLRKAEQGWLYVLTISVENRSSMGHGIYGWWQRVRFPSETAKGFDPNIAPDVETDAEAVSYYGTESLIDSPYPVAPGESFRDEPFITGSGDAQQVCYVETTLVYQTWKLGWTPFPRRKWEYRSQVLIVAVERDDLQPVHTLPEPRPEPTLRRSWLWLRYLFRE